MWTLDRWKEARRVDHVTLNVLGFKFHPRFRDPDGRPNLKVFDAFVTAFWQANNNFDKVTALGEIVAATSQYIAGFVALPAPGGQDLRYLTPVQDLLAEANNDLNLICTVAAAVQRNADIVAMANNQVIVQKVVLVNVFYLAAVGAVPNLVPIDQLIDGHIVIANGLASFTAANLQVARHNAVATLVTDFNGESILVEGGPGAGLFDESRLPIFRLIGYLNAIALPGRVDVVYHDGFVDADVQGFTARRSGVYSGRTPNARPVVLVRRTPSPGGGLTHPTTLAHELGHALTDCGQHAAQPDDLMAAGAIRGAVNQLSFGEKAWFRHNPFAV
ncbi:MAG: hypothetical protein NTZ56_16205 [Acidobacteria bacterium]|nr:hypothetical protein [Acidobacteriota bacterium]